MAAGHGETGAGTVRAMVFVVLSLCALRAFFGLCGLSGSIVVAFAQASPSHQAAIDRYRLALRTLETHAKDHHDLEALFDAVAPVREALLRAADGARSVVESLTDDEYRRVQGELTGVLVNREEALFVEPDPDFFVQLAVGHGDAADRRFFAALKATYPESVFPVYVNQQTDVSGCTRFGSGKLVDTYRVWSDFQRRHPGRYSKAVRKETDSVIGALTESSCACGETTDVERELALFVRAVPAPRVLAKVEERLRALRSGQSNIRPRCRSG